MQEAQRLALQRDLGVIKELLALPFVKRHETRFENEVALVAPTEHLAAVTAAVERALGPAVKAATGPLPGALAQSPLLEAMGGVQDGQALFLKDLGAGVSLYVAYWPWGNHQRFTIKIGVHVVEG
jgi:hypothetical protein